MKKARPSVHAILLGASGTACFPRRSTLTATRRIPTSSTAATGRSAGRG
ncbi:MAG: hypothetical protein IJ658_09685 [Kiritimatiellae bacterium]|nr:hypothetical protein [Kiritimatiellia bacterium]